MSLIIDLTVYFIIPTVGLLSVLVGFKCYLEYKFKKKLKCPVEHDKKQE